MNPEVCILIPCLNEAGTIEATIRDYRSVFPESMILICDNGSSDGTADIARKEGAKVVREPRRGKGRAVDALFRNADAQYFILADGDHTYRAEDAKRLLEKAISERLDMCVGDRFATGEYQKSTDRPFHNSGNRLVSMLISMLFGQRVNDPLSGLRVFSRRFVRTVPLISTGFEIETEFSMQAIEKGFHIAEEPIRYQKRPAGHPSKLRTITDGFRILTAFVRFALYFKPLLLTLFLASICLIISLILGVPPVLEYLEEQYVYKVPSLIVASAFLLMSIIFSLLGFVLETLRYSRMENFLIARNQFDIQLK